MEEYKCRLCCSVQYIVVVKCIIHNYWELVGQRVKAGVVDVEHMAALLLLLLTDIERASRPGAQQQKETQRTRSDGKPTTPTWVKLIGWFTQTSLTAQVHKRARLPSRLKVTLVSGIFRPSTWRLRFLIHTLWNISWTCHHASHAGDSFVRTRGRGSMHRHTSSHRLRFLLHYWIHWQMANKINAILAIKIIHHMTDTRFS